MNRYLLDTHAFIWFVEGNEQLHPHIREAIEDPNNQRFLSIASLWEMSIKVSAGKMEMMRPVATLIEEHVHGNAIELLSINQDHLEAVIELPFHHRDPFDRMMIAQAQVDELILISKDGHFKHYDVDLFW